MESVDIAVLPNTRYVTGKDPEETLLHFNFMEIAVLSRCDCVDITINNTAAQRHSHSLSCARVNRGWEFARQTRRWKVVLALLPTTSFQPPSRDWEMRRLRSREILTLLLAVLCRLSFSFSFSLLFPPESANGSAAARSGENENENSFANMFDRALQREFSDDNDTNQGFAPRSFSSLIILVGLFMRFDSSFSPSIPENAM